MPDEPKTYKQAVSSVTGRAVTPEYATANPLITYRRTVTVKPRRDIGSVNLPEEDALEDELTAEPMMPPDSI